MEYMQVGIASALKSCTSEINRCYLVFGILQKCGEETIQVLKQTPTLNCLVNAVQASSRVVSYSHQHSGRVGLWWCVFVVGVFFTVSFIHFFICPLRLKSSV